MEDEVWGALKVKSKVGRHQVGVSAGDQTRGCLVTKDIPMVGDEAVDCACMTEENPEAYGGEGVLGRTERRGDFEGRFREASRRGTTQNIGLKAQTRKNGAPQKFPIRVDHDGVGGRAEVDGDGGFARKKIVEANGSGETVGPGFSLSIKMADRWGVGEVEEMERRGQIFQQIAEDLLIACPGAGDSHASHGREIPEEFPELILVAGLKGLAGRDAGSVGGGLLKEARLDPGISRVNGQHRAFLGDLIRHRNGEARE